MPGVAFQPVVDFCARDGRPKWLTVRQYEVPLTLENLSKGPPSIYFEPTWLDQGNATKVWGECVLEVAMGECLLGAVGECVLGSGHGRRQRTQNSDVGSDSSL